MKINLLLYNQVVMYYHKHGPGRGESTAKADKGGKIAGGRRGQNIRVAAAQRHEVIEAEETAQSSVSLLGQSPHNLTAAHLQCGKWNREQNSIQSSKPPLLWVS